MSDFEGLMRGLEFCKFAGERDAQTRQVSASATSPAIQFDAPSSQERRPLFQPMDVSLSLAELSQVPDAVNENGRGASIHSGDTIERLISAVVVCEERVKWD